MEYYDPMEMKCPWCRRPSRPGFDGPGGPPRPGFGPPVPPPSRPGFGPGPGGPPPRPGYGPEPGSPPGPPPRPGFGPPPPPPPPGPGSGGPGRPRPCTRCIRPFEAEEDWKTPIQNTKAEEARQAISPRVESAPPDQLLSPENQLQWEQSEQPSVTQPRDTLFQEDEPSTPLTRYYEDDYETERDLERMKSLYPEISKELFPWIEDACDQMEYEGSLMYDESPDQNQIRRLTSRIYEQVKEQYQPPEGEDKDEMLAMNQETWRRYPPDQNWLSDLIQTLLVDEMFRRRCRRRNSRWWS